LAIKAQFRSSILGFERLKRHPIPFMRGFEALTVDAGSKAALQGAEILESRR
jgi:hypothetical protein